MASARFAGGGARPDAHQSIPNTPTYTAAGQVITYTYVVTNNTLEGSGTLISTFDDKVATINCPTTVLNAQTSITCTGTYTITAADVTAGSVTNNASFAADVCNDGCIRSAVASATVTFAAQPSWTLPAPSPTTYTAAGQTINYSYLISNTGNVSIGSITVTDDKVATVTCSGGPVLTPGGTKTCTGSYTTTAADVTAGTVTNTATASGIPPPARCRTQRHRQRSRLLGTPSWTLTKTPTPTAYSAAGQVINYSFLLRNTGDVAVSAISISDNRIATVSCPATTLAVGANMTCTGTYTTTAADVTAESVTNIATATGTPAAGSCRQRQHRPRSPVRHSRPGR